MRKISTFVLLTFALLFLAACQLDGFDPNNTQNPVRSKIQASVTQGTAPLTVSFNATVESGNIQKFDWSFGDGQEGQGQAFSHTYSQVGRFTVRLVSKDSEGNTDTDTVTITVEEPSSIPNPNPAPSPSPLPVPSPTPDPAAVPISAGIVLPLRRAEIEQDFSELAVDGVAFASRQSGSTQLVFFGTITQTANGSFSYNPEPSDRLQLIFSTGLRLEYTFAAFQGDFNQPDGERFLRKDHSLSYRLTSSEGTDVQVELHRINGEYQNTVRGTVIDKGVSYQLDTQTQGTVLSDFGQGSVRYETAEQTIGSVSREGFSAAINETFSYKLVIFDKAAEDIRHTVTNTWTIAEDRFELANATIFRTFSDGRPVELDSWLANGVLTRNGQSFGNLSQEQTLGSIDTVLIAGDEKTILFSDQSF